MTHKIRVCSFLITLFTAGQVIANTPEKLQSRLAELKGTTPISVQFSNEIENIRGEDGDKDQRIRTGNASLNLKDLGNGLEVIYSDAVLSQIEQEQIAKMDNEEVNTPTLMALGNLDAMDFQSMLSASNGITRLITKSEFVSSSKTEDEMQTILRYQLPLEVIVDDRKTREYVNKFEGFYDIHVEEDGTPVYSKLFFKGKGRAWVVMAVSAWLERETHYKLSGDRLLQKHRTGKGGFSTSFFPDTSWSSTESLAEAEQQLLASTSVN